MTPIEEIKSKIQIEHYIGEQINLKKAGTNFKAICPFHQEKTPSFMVSPEKQIWHCFGCNEGGDIISFLQKYDGLEFKAAVETLAQKTGVVMQGFKLPDQRVKKVLYEINDAARVYYEKHLHDASTDSEKTLKYLTSRNLKNDSMRAWSLGLSQDSWDGLLTYLRNKKFSDTDVIEAGLAIRRDNSIYDRFRRRLMFPINDVQGRVVAFTARTLQYIVSPEEDKAGKYVNSPQTSIYSKSQILYGFDKAKNEIRRLKYAIIVEGNMDAIMSHQVGVKNTIAVSGTALTLDQLRLLKRYTENIILSFDADTAGSQAVYRGITLAWDLDMNVKVILLKDSKDPADTIQDDPEVWRSAIKDSIGVVDFYFNEIFSRVDMSRADHKKIAAQKIMGIISRMKTKVEQAHYIAELASRLGVSEDIVSSMIREPHVKTSDARDVVPENKRTPGTFSDHLMSFIIQYPAIMLTVINEIEPEMLPPDLQELYKKMIIHYTKHQSKSNLNISSELSRPELRLWSHLVFQGERLYSELTQEQQEQELRQLIHRVKNIFFTNKLQELTAAIKLAEAAGKPSEVDVLMKEYQALSKKRIS